MAAPPAYEEAQPAYPALQQQNPAPPPAFNQSEPATVVIHQPSATPQSGAVTNGGESYQAATAQRNAPADVVGGGESSGQKQIIVFVQPQNPYQAQNIIYQPANYRRQYVRPRGNKPPDLFSFKIRDHKVNAFGSGPNCVCCCHLQLAAYIFLVIFILYNGFSIESHIVGTLYYTEAYDYLLAAYFALNVLVNIICFVGMLQCKSAWIRPQAWMCSSYIIIAIVNEIVASVIAADTQIISLFDLILTICFCIWVTWVFHRVYRWAYYFERGGPYVDNMYKPPLKNQMVPQIQAAEAVQMQPIPQDGDLL